MTIRVIFAGLSLTGALCVGCGGGGSASPFGGTSLDSRSDLSARQTGANAAGKPQRLVPLFLSTSQNPTAEDQWILLKGIQVSSSSEKHTVVAEGDRLWMRLNSLRSAEGRRYLFVGMAPSGPRLVRAQVSLGATARLFVTGEEKPTDVTLAGGAQGGESLSVNLDSAAELKDALILDLSVSKDASGAWSAKLSLGSAEGVQDPRRHEQTLLNAKIAELGDKPELPWSLALGDGRLKCSVAHSAAVPGSKPGSKPAKGSSVFALGFYDLAGSQLKTSQIVFGEAPKAGLQIFAGQTIAADAQSGTIRVSPVLARGAAPSGTSMEIALPKSVVGEDGQPIGLDLAESLLPGRPVWLVGPRQQPDSPFAATLVGISPTPKIDPNRDRTPIPPEPVKKPAVPN